MKHSSLWQWFNVCSDGEHPFPAKQQKNQNECSLYFFISVIILSEIHISSAWVRAPPRIDHQLILFPLFTSPKFVDWSFSRQIEWRHGYQPLPISALSSSRNVQRFWFGITVFLDSHHHVLRIPTLCKKFSLWARPIVGVTAGSDMDLPNYLNHISFSQVLLFDFWICLISHTIFPFNWFLLLDFLIIPIIHHLKGVLFLALDNYPNQIFFFGFSFLD